jgi:ABC-type amino acid transport substrate-binding protein
LEQQAGDLDAMVSTAEEAAAWSLLYPAYSVVVPEGVLMVPVAFLLPKGEEELADFLKIWTEIKKNDKTIAHLYDYWVLGKQTKHKAPRWSVIRDVLHWVE